MKETGPYALPGKLEPDHARVLAYWVGLRRGEANMPFWDDLNLSALPDLAAKLMLLELAETPMRFRFGMVGDEIKSRYGADLIGKFVDEIEVRAPLQYLKSQISATVESSAPTYYRHVSGKAARTRAPDAYSRLILPAWGDGQIRMLLGAVR